MNTIRTMISVALLTATLTGCENLKITHVEEVRLNETTLRYEIDERGDSYVRELWATIIPRSADDQKIFWENSNPDAVRIRVGADGNIIDVYPIASGAATITAFSNDGRKQAQCIVMVNGWTQKTDFGGTARDMAVSFSIGDKGYIGTGYVQDFWEYDPETDSWTQKADFPGALRDDAVGFSINNKGYIGTGRGINNEKDFWEYDPETDSWTQKADFSGEARYNAVGFSIGNKGYIGMGTGNDVLFQDFWEYDPETDSWTQKANFAGEARSLALGFSIDSKGYIGAGYYLQNNRLSYYSDFWEYDPNIDRWTKKADFPGRVYEVAVSFSIGNRGYIGSDFYNGNFWVYNQASNRWNRSVDFPGEERRYGAVGFSIGDKGYIGNSLFKEFWEFSPE